MKPKRWISAGAVIALALTLITIRSLDAPLFLYPSSASLPAGLYVRSFEPIRPGVIVAFPVPDIARRYQELVGREVPTGYLFIKPVAASSGDRVCNDLGAGLRINRVWIAPATSSSYDRFKLPIWNSCRQLRDREFFVLSNMVPNSFDSRHYGIIQADQMLATYRLFL